MKVYSMPDGDSSVIYDRQVFVDVFADGLVYASKRAMELLRFLLDSSEAYGSKLDVISPILYTLIDFVYSKDDLKSHRALRAILDIHEQITFEMSSPTLSKDIFHCLYFKLRKCQSYRLYDLCLEICKRMFDCYGLEGREDFEFVFERGLNRGDSPYRRALHIEAEYLFNLNTCSDMLPEMDRRCLLRILNFNRVALARFTNLASVSEYLLKSIDKKDTFAIKQYTSFLQNMSDDRVLFNELLTPAKKYLPAVAVLEGFSSIEARRKFVESVNKNSNFQIQNPNSFRVFRNLFHSCRISNGIKANFVETYNSQSSEYKMTILDILVNCLDYDIASFDFIMSRLNDVSFLKTDSLVSLSSECIRIFKTLHQRIFSQPQQIRESIVRYLMEHMHVPIVFHFVDLCIPVNNDISFILTSFLNEYLNSNHSYREQQLLSRAAYNILRYLKKKKCRFNDNKAVLLVYRDLNGVEYGVDALVNWYFKNFSVEDIEVLYRLDNSFLVVSESLLSKIVMADSGPIKLWMLGCFQKHLSSQPCLGSGERSDYDNCSLSSNHFVDRCVTFYLKANGMYKGSEPRSVAFISNATTRSVDSDIDSCSIGLSLSDSDLEDDVSLFYDSEKSEDLVDLFTQNGVSVTENTDIGRSNVSAPENTSGDTRDKLKNDAVDETKRRKVSKPSPGNTPGDACDPISRRGVDTSETRRSCDLSFLLHSFSDNILPILELFCELKIYSKELVEICKKGANSSCRHASLYYLCLFDPSPEYFESIFKLSYHERKYTLLSLIILVDRFGPEQFVNTIKTVIRSEMRLRTSEYILVPLLLARKMLLENRDIFFELCVLAHRLLSKGHLNYNLLRTINESDVSAGFKRELNTIVMLNELETGKLVILGKESEYDRKRVALGAIKSPSKAKIFGPWFEDLDFEGLGLNGLDFRRDVAAVFLNSMMTNLSKKTIIWLGIPPEVYLGSTLDNQMNVLELYLESRGGDSGGSSPSAQGLLALSGEIVLSLLSNLVLGRYSHPSRFGVVYCMLMRLFPGKISDFLLNTLKDGEFVYPPLFEYLPEVFELSEPEVSVKLAVRRPSNLPLDMFEMNILHLFRVMPFSLDALKKEFFSGLSSRNRLTRKCYLDMLLGHVPTDIFSTLRYILLFDYSGLEDGQIEYFVAVLLYRALNFREPVLSVDCTAGKNANASGKGLGGVHWYEFVSPRKSAFRYDLLCYSLDNQRSVLCFLVGVFKKLDLTNLHFLYRLYCDGFACNSMRIKAPFIKAFISEGIKVNDLLYNPHYPSLKFYELMDRPMYLGLAKVRAGLRETKGIVEMIGSGLAGEQIILSSAFELFKKVDTRQASYNSEDINILEAEVRRIYAENGQETKRMSDSAGASHHFCSTSESVGSQETIFSSSVAETTEVEQIEQKFCTLIDSVETEKTSMDEVMSLLSSLPVLSHVPRNSPMFSRLLMFSSIASEMIESSIILKDNLSDSIYGRFRMWMIRHPSFLGSFADWNVFVKWRTFIFSKAIELVSENDKKKISSEMCRLNCIYATKAFKEKLHQKSSFILNEVSSITTVEVSQNMQRILLDLENLYALKDYSTMVSLVNSLNITRFSNEDKSRLYFWAYKAFKRLRKGPDSERFGNLSRKLSDILENKKEDLEVLKERLKLKESVLKKFDGSGFDDTVLKKADYQPNSSIDDSASNNGGILGDGLVFAITSKLVEIINESTVEDSRPYVIQLLQTDPSQLDLVSHQKLYFFIPQIRNTEFLFAKNPLLKSSTNVLEVFRTLSANSAGPSGLMAEKAKLYNMLRTSSFADKKLVDGIGKLAGAVFDRELRSMLRTSRSRRSIYSFDKETALPGEFVYLRNKYDDVKTMEYIEEFYSDDGTFFVRNTDGTLCKIVSSPGESNSLLMQFMQLASTSIKSQSLDKLFFGLPSIPTINAAETPGNEARTQQCFSVHKNLDYSVDSFVKLQLFKKNIPVESVLTRYLGDRVSSSKLSAFIDSFVHWKDLFKLEVLERVVDFNDFYVFKRNFISSYSSLICFQYVLGCNSISLEHLYVERGSGLAYINLVDGSKRKFYLRPNLSSLFGAEGLNGPLCMILKEFCRNFQSEDISRIVDFFFDSDELRSEIQKRVLPVVESGLDSAKAYGDVTPQTIVGEMVDPKNGAGLCASLMPWL